MPSFTPVGLKEGSQPIGLLHQPRTERASLGRRLHLICAAGGPTQSLTRTRQVLYPRALSSGSLVFNVVDSVQRWLCHQNQDWVSIERPEDQMAHSHCQLGSSLGFLRAYLSLEWAPKYTEATSVPEVFPGSTSTLKPLRMQTTLEQMTSNSHQGA